LFTNTTYLFFEFIEAGLKVEFKAGMADAARRRKSSATGHDTNDASQHDVNWPWQTSYLCNIRTKIVFRIILEIIGKFLASFRCPGRAVGMASVCPARAAEAFRRLATKVAQALNAHIFMLPMDIF
jgi:hypothetical protein